MSFTYSNNVGTKPIFFYLVILNESCLVTKYYINSGACQFPRCRHREQRDTQTQIASAHM